MKDETKNITCPECGASISIDDALTHQIENKLKKEYEDKEKSLRESIEKESSKKLEQDKTEMEKKIKAQILKDAEAKETIIFFEHCPHMHGARVKNNGKDYEVKEKIFL